jgi:hypothetical protein
MDDKSSNNTSMEHHILANAELVREVARKQLGTAIQYDEAGVRWLDGYIDVLRESASEETKAKLPSTLGSFLGECIRQAHDGRWVQDPEHGWMVKINERVSVYPFNKVEKQLANEDGDSVLGLFTAISPMLLHFASSQKASTETEAKTGSRPWWKLW